MKSPLPRGYDKRRCYYVIVLIKHLYSIDVWFDEDERTNTKQHMCERHWSKTLKLIKYSTLSSENNYRRTYVVTYGIHKHTTMVIITKPKEA